MAKPIFVVKIPIQFIAIEGFDKTINRLSFQIKEEIKDEYFFLLYAIN